MLLDMASKMLKHTTETLEGILSTLKQVNGKLDALDRMNTELASIDKRLASIEGKLDKPG